MIVNAMKQALEALDLALSDEPYFVKAGIAMVALRQAIEQAEKQQWVSLTDEQITTLLRRVTLEASLDMLYVTESGMNVFAKQLEQQLKDANT